MANVRYIRCSKCGSDATPRKPIIENGQIIQQHESGTTVTMHCEDCTTALEKPYATMCRECCPTGHGTKF